ncbi:MAG TPA: RNA polymerase sigma factor [Bryobacteraceae bacterium]|nr:RNA polymerase sigma factor [Bryobacteraceae bacterium]
MASDEVLMLEFQAGSRESFEELFARYRDPLHAFFRRRLASRESAEDLAQETWMAVLRGAVRYQPRALFRTYLYAIALRLLAGERRKNSQRRVALVADTPVAGPELPEADHWIRAALEKLDATEREIIMLREYEQLSYAEIAGLLRIPLNTVRSRLFRARVALKDLLEPASEAITAEGRS